MKNKRRDFLKLTGLAGLTVDVGPLSEWSVAHRSNSVDVPDFTAGAWKTNKPGMDISLLAGVQSK